MLWFGCMTLHVLTYVWRLPRLLLGTPGRARMAVPGSAARWLLVGAALAGGLILALATIHLAGPWDARFAFR